MARAALPVRLAIAGLLVAATMVALPQRLWQPQLLRLGSLCGVLFLFTLIGALDGVCVQCLFSLQLSLSLYSSSSV